MADTSYGPKVYHQQGGDRQVVASGGSLDVESGGEIDIESGGALKIAGSAVTATATQINKLVGAGATVASGTTVAAIVGVSGGAVIDAEARTAVNSILTALRAWGIVTP